MSGDQTFPRNERVTRTRDLDRVFTEGRRARGPFMTLRVLDNGLPHARLGVALSRGWSGAVARNRAKRLLREAYRTHKHLFPPGLDVVVVPRPNWRPPAMAELVGEFERLLARLSKDEEP